MQLLCSVIPFNFDSVQEEKKIRFLCNNSGVQDQIVFINSFISQNELSERLFLSDLGFLWGDKNYVENSAASKEFVCAKLPLIIPRSSHYKDIFDEAYVFDGDKNLFVKKMFELLFDDYSLNNIKNRFFKLYEKLNYNYIIKEYLELYKKLLSDRNEKI